MEQGSCLKGLARVRLESPLAKPPDRVVRHCPRRRALEHVAKLTSRVLSPRFPQPPRREKRLSRGTRLRRAGGPPRGATRELLISQRTLKFLLRRNGRRCPGASKRIGWSSSVHRCSRRQRGAVSAAPVPDGSPFRVPPPNDDIAYGTHSKGPRDLGADLGAGVRALIGLAFRD